MLGKKNIRLLAALLLLTPPLLLANTTSMDQPPRLQQLELKQATINDAVRLLARLGQANIAATSEAGTAQVSLLLHNVTVDHAVDMLARVSGLWYRHNSDNNSYVFMTEQQYRDDIVVFRKDSIRNFTLRHQNVNAAANTIQSLFGDRVHLLKQTGNDDFSGLGFSSVDQATTITTDTNPANGEVTATSLPTNTTGQAPGEALGSADLSVGELRKLGQDQISTSVTNQVLGAKAAIYIATNSIHNLLFVRTSDANAMAEIAKLIKANDRPTPAVMLEMKIIDISMGDGYDQSADFSFSDGLNISDVGIATSDPADINALSDPQVSIPEGTSIKDATRVLSQINGDSVTGLAFAAASGGYYEFFSNYINARVNMLVQNKRANIISKPILMASNNRRAELFFGSEQVLAVGMSTDQVTSTTEGGSQTSTSVSYEHQLETELRRVGSNLYLLPSINADRTVTIDILQSTSTLKTGGMNFPYFNNSTSQVETVALDTIEETNLKTVVVAKDGMTIALGGTIRQQDSQIDSQIPVLGDIPLLGELFRSSSNSTENSQYIMLITPHIMLAPGEGEATTRQIDELDYSHYAEVDIAAPGATAGTDFRTRDYIDLVRAVAAGATAKLQDMQPVPVTIQPPMQLLNDPQLGLAAAGSWERQGMYITRIRVSNRSGVAKLLDLSRIAGNWLAAAGNMQLLSAAGYAAQGDIYLLSDQPFDTVAQTLARRIN